VAAHTDDFNSVLEHIAYHGTDFGGSYVQAYNDLFGHCFFTSF